MTPNPSSLLVLGALLLWTSRAPAAELAPQISSRQFASDEVAKLAEAEELEEVKVLAEMIVRSEKAITEWLRRLLGEHSYEGYLEFSDEGVRDHQAAARGSGRCVPYGEAPAVLCVMSVLWEDNMDKRPGWPVEALTLAPAVTLYGIDMHYLGVRSMQIDNAGMANGGLGYLRGDTLTISTVSESSGELRGDTVAWQLPCPYVKNLPGSGCRMTMRYTAPAHGEYVRFEGSGGTMSGGGRTSGDIWYRLSGDQDGSANAPDSLLNQPVRVPSLGIDAPAPRGPR